LKRFFFATNRILKENAFVLGLYLVLLFAGEIVTIFYSKENLHIAINQLNTPFLDLFFKYFTFLGSGWTILVLFVVFMFVKVKYALSFLTGNIIITLIVQGLKHFVFSDALRPAAYLKNISNLHFVSGVELNIAYSFPSGHSATAFGIFMMLIYITKNPTIKFLWLTIALLTAFSRVYLSQHFFQDILAGSLIGVACMFLTECCFERYYLKSN